MLEKKTTEHSEEIECKSILGKTNGKSNLSGERNGEQQKIWNSKIIVIALILSITANLGIIIKLVLQTNLIENLTTKNQMIENKNIEMEAIIKDLKGKNQEAQSKLQISEHINQEKEKLSQRINVLTEENKTLKLQLQNHQKKEKLEE